MPLPTGTELAHYQVLGPLGAGAMGEVYRARDSRLDREVAIKVLPPQFAADAERLKRFEREAKSLASLNHPNVAQIHGVDQHGSTFFLVLELVPGESLEARLLRGPLPVAEAVDVCRQIADGLEAAHEAGVIHRDLKPANVRLTPDGKVKVLDFGLAKSSAPTGVAGSAMDSVLSTEAGRLIGTPTYMAPEQARGRPIDRRVDVWAFGCVLFECLTAKRAFAGETLTDVLASVLDKEPDFTRLPANTPAHVRTLLARCLHKDPRLRLRDIGEARLCLLGGSDATATAPAAMPGAARARVAGWRLAGISALAAILATFGAMRWFAPAATAAAASSPHLTVTLPDNDELAMVNMQPLALSPDGSTLVYVGRRDGRVRLFVRKLTDTEPTALPDTDGARSPFFAPDGRWLGFFADGKLKKITVGGTGLSVVTDAPDARGGCWATDDTIYFAPTNISGIWRVAAAGGPATEFVRKDQTLGEITLRWPHVLPDGKGLLFTAWTGPGPDENQIVFRSLAADGARSVLARGGNMPVYAPTGHLLYGRLDQLFALPWTPGHAGPGDAVPVALPEMPRLEGEGAADYAVANDGTLAYLAGGPTHRAHRLVFVDRAGKVEALPVPEREYESVVVSPDGRQAAVQVLDGTTGLWLYDFAHQTLSPLLTRGGSNQAPVWTPDSKRIVYRGTRNGSRNLYAMAADGTGVEERLTNQPDVVQTPQCVTPDGHWLLFSNSGQGATGGSTHVWRVELAGSHKTEPVIEGASRTNNGRVSPDGNWLAVESWASGRAEICVMHLPGPGPLQQVSTDGGTEPLWSHDGRELFFVNIDRLLAVDVGQGPDFAPGTPHVLHEGRFRANINSNTAYDLAPDGRRFLRIQQVRPVRTVNTIDVVLNWFTELRRVAAPK